MKRRISDMLDRIPAENIDLDQSTPLSSQRIKELTMMKIEHKEKKRGRIGVRILALAAAISMLGVTAFAAEEIFGAGDFFRSILGIQLQESKDHAADNNLDVTYAESISEEQVESMKYDSMDDTTHFVSAVGKEADSIISLLDLNAGVLDKNFKEENA